MNLPYPEQPLRQLPIDVRPTAGERAEVYIRRLARANHLRPSFLRRYLAGPPEWHGKIEPERLAAVTGRPAALLQRTLAARGWPQPEKARSGYLRRRHGDKPALYAKIRVAAAIENLNQKELAARFRVGRRTIIKALDAPEPPPWKPPYKKRSPAYAASIDALLDAAPDLTILQLWEQVVDYTEINVSYATIGHYLKRRRQQAQIRDRPVTERPGHD